MSYSSLFCAALFLIALVDAPVHAAKKLCPEGQFYTCTGGINGVNCRCVKPVAPGDSVSPFNLIWDVADGTTSISTGEVVLSALIESSSECAIDYTLEVNRLNSDEPEQRVARNMAGTLSAARPVAIVQIDPDSTSTRLRQYIRLRGSGSAQACSLQEFLSFEITTIAYDPMTDAVLNQRNVRPNFLLDDQDQIPPITLPRPAPIGTPE